MKPLTPKDLIELIPPEPATVDAALRKFEFTAPALCREPGYCRELFDEGFITPAQINWGDSPAFFLGWRLTTDRGLWVDVAQTLSGGAPIEVLVNGVFAIADQKGARYVRFLTMRRGLVKVAQQHGFRAEAVLMVKTP